MFETMGHFLRRLRKNTAGNTLAMIGIALIPITAMIGSGLDISRAYMAKSRLQSACDASSLAARRVLRTTDLTEEMIENNELPAPVIETGEQFFNFNFQPGMYHTEEFTPAITSPESGIVRVEAATRIPTTVMKAFGVGSIPLSVSCDASLNFVNTDVVLVLDVTGSMNDPVDGTRKIEALQEAVMALYDELEPVQQQLQDQGLRLRYGIVPYSSTVNVGRLLMDENPSYMRTSAPYQSRSAVYNNSPVYISTDTPITSPQPGLLINPGAQRFRISGVDRLITNANCTHFGNNNGFSQTGTAPNGGTFTATGINNDADIYVREGMSTAQANPPAAPIGYTRYRFTRLTGTWNNNPANRVCDRTVTVTRRTYETRYNFSNWIYREETLDTSDFITGGTITLATNAPSQLTTHGSFNQQQLATLGASTTSASWNGCIEERNTVNTITAASGLTIPDTALDLRINVIPNNDASRWRPMLPEAVYRRATGTTVTNPTWSPTSGTVARTANTNWQMNFAADQGFYACPAEAARLQEWTRDDLDDYVGNLTPIGGTYHDIGMIWGARLISTGGVFADGCEEFNEMPCNRHVIFMTDGAQTAYCNVYSAYGVERNDRRVGNFTDCHSDAQTNSTTLSLLSRHQQRFRMICNATRNMNVSVWVIAFDTGLTADLTNCASNAGQARTSANRAELIAQFRQIGNQIGALRLTR